MGKKHFKHLYRSIKRQLGNLTCKTSYFSDNFDPNLNYAGVIIYAIDGKFRWKNSEGGKADGFNGRSFYMIIQCTNYWPEETLKAAGQGRVHDYLLRNVLGIEFDQDRIACGGFAYINGELKFSSIWLNARDQIGGESDNNKNLSDSERLLVTYCFNEYKEHGTNQLFPIPWYVEQKLLF